MTEKAFETTAQYYDILYADKDYAKEADFIENCINRYFPARTILELGCGTGSYTKIFSEKGYKVIGIDISAKMLEIARKKSKSKFLNLDMRNFFITERFDCCLALFAVLGYVTSNSDVEKVFKNVRSHLVLNGLFIFDIWNGLAVMRNLPEIRVKNVENASLKISRTAQPTLKPIDHTCEVEYQIIIEEKNPYTRKTVNEKHLVRFFFPKELEYYLSKAGFELLRFCPFMNFDDEINENVWNMTIIAKAV
jgi:SAM-dependent methyltransferase